MINILGATQRNPTKIISFFSYLKYGSREINLYKVLWGLLLESRKLEIFGTSLGIPEKHGIWGCFLIDF
jgi:hypothetical protein